MPYHPRVDLDQPVHDRLVVRTVAGAVDYLAQEVRGLDATVVRREPDRLVIDYAGPLRPLSDIRYFDVLAVDLPDDPDPAVMLARLAHSVKDGALAALRPADGGPLRFRVGDLGARRWPVRDAVATHLGWANDPHAWDVNLVAGAAEIGALYLTRRYGELQRTPASTNPVIAAVMVRLAKIEPGQTVLDPFCGAGTLLVLAAELARPGRLVGLDVRDRWLRLAAANLATRLGLGRAGVAAALARADAGRLPLAGGSVDRVLANLPFGKRVGSHRVNAVLYPAALAEIARVLAGRGRAVLLTDDKRLFTQAVQRTRLVRVVREIVLARGGLHPSAYVIAKRGK